MSFDPEIEHHNDGYAMSHPYLYTNTSIYAQINTDIRSSDIRGYERGEDWCRCDGRVLKNNLPREFLSGLTEFKKQWLICSENREENEIENITRNHNQDCVQNYISWSYSLFCDNSLGDD